MKYDISIGGREIEFEYDKDDKNKYVVFTCIRGESEYIEEFVEHYLSLGFDKIILANNDEKGDDSVYNELKGYVDDGTVQIIDLSGFESFQVELYARYCSIGNFKWCAFFDADEFLEIPSYSSIKDFLSEIKEDVVSFNWLTFGSNGEKHKKHGTVQKRFPEPITPIPYFTVNFFIKSIVRGGTDNFNDCWFNGSHTPITHRDVVRNIGGYTNTVSFIHTSNELYYKKGYLKHYYTKSFDEWIKKSSRGWPDGTPTLNTSLFFDCERKNAITCDDMVLGFFNASDTPDDFVNKDILDNLREFNLWKLENYTGNVFAFLNGVYSIMSRCKNHVFCVNHYEISEQVYAMLLEYAYMTSNKLVCIFNDRDFSNVYDKYVKNNKGYYIEKIG